MPKTASGTSLAARSRNRPIEAQPSPADDLRDGLTKGERMSLTDDLAGASGALPVRLEPQKDGSLAGEAVLAERKAFLSKKKLTYKCKARVDEGARVVRFWEMLIEKGSGVSSGGDDFGPGGGFSAGTYKTGGKERSGSIETVSSLFGKDYSYQWDYAAVRTGLQQVAAAAGYGWETVLNPKSV